MLFDYSAGHIVGEPLMCWTGYIAVLPGGQDPGSGELQSVEILVGSTSETSQQITGTIGQEI